MLAAAGIETPEELDRLGSVEAYRRVLGAGCPPTLNLLYALDATLLGLDWRDLPLDRKEQLRRELTSGGR